MLEVSHLSKIYKTKGGEDVKALDDVSVKFPETGMVFLLGKSGSGKSTLLNVCGGLDNPTKGEIIVKGRSSKHFSQSDFDSYRNTFIGFIFQEYNILNEFSVEDNIALALELQGKSKDKAAIAALLEQVDLTGYAKRKPNTLSGGQKQRIAIARALIKAPEIIMADEPTGALDSNTGKQVFDTLKKLSKEKLVIVVSHDREFAELYGDRVIELKDGKILSDVSKTHEDQVSISENVTAIGDTICIKSGADLSDADFKEIKAFLKKSEKDVIIASGEKDVKSFKEVSRITEDGQKEVFRDTDENKFEKKNYKPEDSKFIRSKLPMRHAMKIGASGLRTKPFRLLFTVLLSTIAFVMFGLFSTMMLYEKEATLYQSIDDANPSVLRITKKYKYLNCWQSDEDSEPDSYEDDEETPLTPAEVTALASKFGGETFGVVALNYSSWEGAQALTMTFDSSESVGSYYKSDLTYGAYLPENHPMRNKITIGTYPTQENEICISSYSASVLVAYKLGGATDANGLIGKEFELRFNGLGNATFKISGIFDSKDQEMSSKYTALQDASQHLSAEEKESLQKKLEADLSDGMHLVAFLTENTLGFIIENNANNSSQQDIFQSIQQYKYKLQYHVGENYNSSAYYIKASDLTAGEHYFFYDNAKTTLADDETLITLNMLNTLSSSNYNWEVYEALRQEFETAQNEANMNSDPNDDMYADFYQLFDSCYVPEESSVGEYRSYIYFTDTLLNKPEYAELKAYYNANKVKQQEVTVTLGGKEYKETVSYLLSCAQQGQIYDSDLEDNITLTKAEKQAIIKAIAPKLQTLVSSFTGKVMKVDGQETAVNRGAKELKIVGILLPKESWSDFIAVSDATYTAFKTISDEENPNYNSSRNWRETNYQKASDAVYNAIFIPYNSSLKGELSMFTFEWAADDSRLVISHAVGNALEMVNSMISEMSTVFMWIGIVMAVFAALLLSNFISVSISHKKKDIGILRAVGARSFDVFKIFFSESFFIALISIIVSLVGCFFACSIINTEVGAALSGVSLFVFGPVSIIILIGVALGTAVLATFLPVWNAAKKKPVESIRAL